MKSDTIDRRAHPKGASFSDWEAGDGWRLRWMHWPQGSDSTPHGSLIFAGGRGDFIEKYLEALAHWHGRGWDVTSFDWRGQGASRGTIVGGHLDSFDPLVADGAALIAEWRRSSPPPHVVIGHSMGGHLLLRILAEHHPSLDAAVLVAPMVGINASPVPPSVGRRVANLLCALGWRTRPAWKQNERPSLTRVSRQSFLTTCPERYADELWWKGQQPGYSLGPPSWGWLSAAYRSIASLAPEKLRSVKLPLLILGTERDRLVSPAAIKRAAAFLPDVRLHMFPSAAHELLRESDPVRLEAFRRIDDFLDEQAR